MMEDSGFWIGEEVGREWDRTGKTSEGVVAMAWESYDVMEGLHHSGVGGAGSWAWFHYLTVGR